MTNAFIAPNTVSRFFDNNGNQLVGGLVYSYSSGSVIPIATYTDSTASQANTNPIVLNSRGEAQIWWPSGVGVKLVVTDSSGNQISSTDQLFTNPNPTITQNGQFVATGVGFTSPPSATITWSQFNNEITATISPVSGTSNSTTFGLLGIPTAIQPPTLTQMVSIPTVFTNNGGALINPPMFIQIPAAGSTWFIGWNQSTSSFIASGVKALNNAVTFSYQLV